MSSRFKLCSGAEAVKKFQKAGWHIDRTKGSHIMLVKPDYPYTLSELFSFLSLPWLL